MGPANNVTDSLGIKDALRLCDNFIGRFSDKKAMPTVRRHYFLWDSLVPPSKLKQSKKNIRTTVKPEAAKFSGIQENLSSERIFNKGDFCLYSIFSFRNVCCDRKLCITRAAAIVMWHNNCSLLPVARTSMVSSRERQHRDLKRNFIFCLSK
jgi:hypothetical protein